VFVGDGTEKKALEDFSKTLGLGNVQFLPLQPAEEVPEMLSAADILLLNQSATVVDMVLPGKILFYMAAGRAVIASAHDKSDTADCLRGTGSGLIVPPDDPDALAEAILKLSKDPASAERMGKSGRIYAEQNFSRQKNVTFFESALKTILAGEKPTSPYAPETGK
jgi:colanic acid biosynthesis glycosyl transferase WcaI